MEVDGSYFRDSTNKLNLLPLNTTRYGIIILKVKFKSKMAIGEIRAKLFFQLFSKKHEKIKKIKKFYAQNKFLNNLLFCLNFKFP